LRFWVAKITGEWIFRTIRGNFCARLYSNGVGVGLPIGLNFLKGNTGYNSSIGKAYRKGIHGVGFSESPGTKHGNVLNGMNNRVGPGISPCFIWAAIS